VRAVWRRAAGLVGGMGRCLLPPHCVVCGRSLGRWACLCGGCRGELSLIGERACPRCGRPVGPHLPVGSDCVECRRLPLARVAAVAAAGTYEGGLREMVLRFKSRQRRDLTRTLADLVAGRLRARPWGAAVEVVVPVPLHWRRRWARGFNQAAALAAGLGATLGHPVAPRALRRVRWTPSQVGLSVAERVRNVAGTVRLVGRARIEGATVLLVDDVMTTGATLSECARVLRRGGARLVYGAVVAVRHRSPLVADEGLDGD
jgi:ComF family protein